MKAWPSAKLRALNLGLTLLRDANENIRLEVPMEGNLNNPQVPVGRLVSQVLGKALAGAVRKAALSFFPSAQGRASSPSRWMEVRRRSVRRRRNGER